MSNRSKPGCKVCRVSHDRALTDVDDRLLTLWQGDDGTRLGYRKLATWFNVRILRREMDQVGLTTLGKEAESTYERLRSDDPAISTEVRRRLEMDGLDVDTLEDDFVSYGVIRTHLKECLGAEHEQPSSDWETDAIAITKGHAESKFAEAVSSLITKGNLETQTEIEVSVNVMLECGNCQAQIPLDRALRRGYVCNCQSEL